MTGYFWEGSVGYFPYELIERTKRAKFASDFKQEDAQLLKVSFQPASFKDVIPSLQNSGALFQTFVLEKH